MRAGGSGPAHPAFEKRSGFAFALRRALATSKPPTALAASISGVMPSASTASTIAPSARSVVTVSVCPAAAATSSGVVPCASAASTSALPATRSRTIEGCPRDAARDKAEAPLLSRAFGSAPAARMAATIGMLPLATACISTVVPCGVTAPTLAPAPMRASTVASELLRAASMSAVAPPVYSAASTRALCEISRFLRHSAGISASVSSGGGGGRSGSRLAKRLTAAAPEAAGCGRGSSRRGHAAGGVGAEGAVGTAQAARGHARPVQSDSRHLGKVARGCVHQHALATPVDRVGQSHRLRFAHGFKNGAGAHLRVGRWHVRQCCGPRARCVRGGSAPDRCQGLR